jgi:serine/threonine-protein kinase
MAPEQMRSSKDVTPRSDVWALGVVLFQLLAGKMPFEAESLPELCFKVAQDPPASLRDLVPGMPSEIYDIVDRCLQKRPDDRFQDASELATALEPFAPPAASIVAERARMVTGVNMRLRGPTVMERPATAQTWRSADMPEASASGARAAMTPAAWDSKQRERQGPSKTRVSWVARGVGALAAIGVATLGLVLWHARSTGTGGTGDNTGGASTSRATETQGRDPAPAAPASTAGAAPVVALTPVPAAAASVALPEHPAADHAEASSPASGAAVVAPSGSASAASLGPGASSRRADAKPSTAGRPPRPAQDDIPTMR